MKRNDPINRARSIAATMRTGLQLPMILSIFLSILASAHTQFMYSPPDNILINCGSSGSTKDPWRTWLGDTNSKYSPSGHATSQIPQPTNSQPITSVQQVPYYTARLSRSQFNYSIPLARPSGPVFLRLHFFPSEYPTFNTSAFFSVRAGPYTLLTNFSASLNVRPSTSTVYREFCIVVAAETTLNLTFTPSQDYPDSYAFINGIEVVSMPEFLYYSKPTDILQIVGGSVLFSVDTKMGLEMAYRINAGSKTLNPNQDTGMSRIWEEDNDYLTIDLSSVTPVNINSTEFKLNFSLISNYTAPAVVYQTARTMGTDKTTNMHYNLTWGFPVDPGFNYLVRLHFCEFQNEINDEHDREFTIFIGGMTATARADIISWTGGKGIPFYQDYVVVMGTGSSSRNNKVNLTVALQTRKPWMTKYSDAILNGLEIFKISNEGSLAGPNPDLVLSTAPPPDSPFSPRKSHKTWILIASVTVAGAATLSLLFFFIFRRPGAKHSRSSHGGASKFSPLSMSTNKSSTAKGGSSLPSNLCRHFSLAEIKTATNGFDRVFIIGVGGFGNVYKGFIDGEGGADRVPVAIKRLNPGSQQGAREFMTEIEMLSRLRHLNLVSLIGYCEENGEMILVYDYMSRGTLHDHLHDSVNAPLSWDQRLEICIGAASGLQYLHTGAKHPIIHRDVKSTNILLDDKWVAKVSDFGLSRTGATSVSDTHVTTMVKGSLGYLDPEYRRRQHLTEKSDVYSFGVVLFEVLCGRPALLNRTAERKQVSLAEWGQYCYEQGTVDEIVDEKLKGKIAPECLKKYSKVAVRCLHESGAERPSMSDVAWDLKFVLEMQQTADERNKDQLGSKGGDLMMNIIDDELSFSSDSKSSGITKGSNSSDQSFIVKDSDALLTSNTVFSEINNPIGR